jgi:hypothetical protein
MKNAMEKLKEIECGEVGLLVYLPACHDKLVAINEGLPVPLASAAKVAIAFWVTKLVEEGRHTWNDIVTGIRLNPKEDSKEVYPHFQNRETLRLGDAVEVMIACHDSFVADCIIGYCGGWEQMNRALKTYFPRINVTQNPRDLDNKGEIKQVFELLLLIYEGYNKHPELWMPIINGFVRQRGEIEGIPAHRLNYMSGGLDNALVNMGFIGEFSKDPWLFVLGARNFPSRSHSSMADTMITEVIQALYSGYVTQSEQKI